jgi:hypothetical protein
MEFHFDYVTNRGFSYYNNSYYAETTSTWRDNDGSGPAINNIRLFTNRNTDNFFEGHIGEVVFYYGPDIGYIGDGMRERCALYLMDKWGIV